MLLATDGMLETFFPMYIKNEPVNIHVSLAQYFMDNSNLRINKLGQERVQQNIKKFVEEIPEAQVNDDKTIVVLINTAIKTKRQPKDYYKEPDWAELKRKHDDEWRKMAYPGLYKDSVPKKPKEESNIQSVNLTNLSPALTFNARLISTGTVIWPLSDTLARFIQYQPPCFINNRANYM